MMAGEKGNYFADIAVALLLALLAASVMSFYPQATLDGRAYATSLALKGGQISTPEMALHSIFFSILSPLLGSPAQGTSYVKYFLFAPIALFFMIAGFAYAALRMWGFGKMESASATVLLLFGALVPAFYPGIFEASAFSILFAVIGICGVLVSARARENEGEAAYELAGAALGAIMFCLAVWANPWAVFIPVSLFLAELSLHRGRFEKLLAAPLMIIIRIIALLAPVGVFFALGNIGAKIDLQHALGLVSFAPFCLGLALTTLLYLYWNERHEQAPAFAILTVMAFVAAVFDLQVAALLLLLPSAYALQSLRQWKDCAPLLKALLIFIPISVLMFGFASGGDSGMRPLSYGVLGGLAFIVLAYLYDWEEGNLARFGLPLLMCIGAIIIALQFTPQPAQPGFDYATISPDTQRGLVWIGSQNYSGYSVAAFAPPAAIELLSGSKAQFENRGEFASYLSQSAGKAPQLPKNTVAVLTAGTFDEIGAQMAAANRSWSLQSFMYLRTVKTGTGATSVGQFISGNGLVLLQPLDEFGNIALDSGEIYASSGYVGRVPVGQMVQLYPGKPVSYPGNLAVRPSKEHGSVALDLFQNNGTHETLYDNGTVKVVMVD